MSTTEPQAATATPSSSSKRFESLALNPATLANLQQLGYLEMTPIQAASLPAALGGNCLLYTSPSPRD